jgi:PST family polysaccharide transporter
LFGRQLISVALKFIGVLLITRVLGPEGYGSYVAAFGVYQYILSIGQAGIGVFLVRHEGTPSAQHYGTATSLLLILSLTVAVVVEAAVAPMSAYVGVTGFSEVIRIMILALPLQTLSIPAVSNIERSLNYRAVAMVELGGQVVYYFVAIPLVYGYGAIGLAYAWIAQQFVTFALAYYLARQRPTFGWDSKIAREIIAYSWTFSFANWIWQARSLVNPFVVGPALGGYAVGIVGMTIGILEMLSILKTIAWRLSVSVLARVQSDHAKLVKALSEGMEIQTLAIGSILLGFSWFGQWIIPLVFGARWLPVLDIYPFVAASYLTIALFNIHSATLSVLHLNKPLAIYHLVHIVVFAAAAQLLVPLLGMKGYGWAELSTLPVYFLLHRAIARAIGSPDYRLALIWWSGALVGLFWREIGLWAIAAPFVALVVPSSTAKLKSYFVLVRQRRATS